MRPRKVLLLLDDEETRRRVRVFVLQTRGKYRVLCGAKLPRLRSARVEDLLCRAKVAIVDQARGGVQLCAKLQRMLTGIPVLHLAGPDGLPKTTAAIVRRRNRRDEGEMAGFLNDVRILATRRRGPKKGTHASSQKKPAGSVRPRNEKSGRERSRRT